MSAYIGWQIGWGNVITGDVTIDGDATVSGNVLADRFLGNAADGAGAPTFSWVSNPNKGMFDEATNIVGFAAGGARYLRVVAGRTDVLNGEFVYAAALRGSGVVMDSLATNQNDYAPPGVASASALSIDATADVDITGLATDGTGRLLPIISRSIANSITLKHEDALSAASNRFRLPGGVDLVLTPTGGALAWYSFAEMRWRVF